jgi:hypothetical protein
MNSTEELCPVCGTLIGEELTPEAYKVVWDAIPALDAGQTIYCPECSRELTANT